MIEEERQNDFDADRESTKKGLRTTKSSIPLSFLAAAIISPDTRTIPWSTNKSVSTAALGNFQIKPKEVVVGLVNAPPLAKRQLNLTDSLAIRDLSSRSVHTTTSLRSHQWDPHVPALSTSTKGVTRSGVYNFRVQGSVCHRMRALPPPLNHRPMFTQVYINDPDMEARVAS
ncbi:LOW QUALITY PROTEIN: Helitron helicase-like protein [Phytophthora palmivora]|uniref:Helitron helicase-like protein n=1 Tax=Phytophthora palmivora TaxID=4796 RepID=A0A2P4WZR0_9STRA|nr:LOW QUALITY PROTEIN: Helitron helicase-like protein [Phytophthora palmivora]